MVLYGLWWLSMGLVLSHLDDVTDELLFAIGSFVATYSGSSENVVLFSVGRVPRRSPVPGLFDLGPAGSRDRRGRVAEQVQRRGRLCGGRVRLADAGRAREPVKTSARKVAATLATLAVTVAVGYAAAEGNFQDLLAFFRYSFVIAGDYSAQMSVKGPMWQVALMAGLVTAVVGYVFAGARLDWKSWDTAIILLPVFMSKERHHTARRRPLCTGGSRRLGVANLSHGRRLMPGRAGGNGSAVLRGGDVVLRHLGVRRERRTDTGNDRALGTVGLLAFGDFSDVRNPSREGWFGPRVRRAGVLAVYSWRSPGRPSSRGLASPRSPRR